MLTYAAELAVTQSTKGLTRAEFISSYLSNGVVPANFHSFVYLRGLDGQTVRNTSDSAQRFGQRRCFPERTPESIEEQTQVAA